MGDIWEFKSERSFHISLKINDIASSVNAEPMTRVSQRIKVLTSMCRINNTLAVRPLPLASWRWLQGWVTARGDTPLWRELLDTHSPALAGSMMHICECVCVTRSPHCGPPGPLGSIDGAFLLSGLISCRMNLISSHPALPPSFHPRWLPRVP